MASEVFPSVAANTLSRDNFGRSARGLVEASGLDGIDSKSSHYVQFRGAALVARDLARRQELC